MADDNDGALAAVARLTKAYDVYDQQVDVVCAFEWIFTEPEDMRATVKHFERFPKVKFAADQDPATPDFTVLFNDDTALIGEISRLSLKDESIDAACSQINRYDELTQVQDATGNLVTVTSVDVMQIVTLDVGPDAVDRIITQRLLNPDHPYIPSKPPCIVQFARDPDRYMFQRINDPVNGTLEGHQRSPHLGERIRQLNVRAERFTHIKSNRKFMNDPIPSLYLATHLYTATWPTQHGARRGEIQVSPAETAQLLRQQFGVGTAADVRNALGLLVSAGLAAANGDNTWTVSAKPPRLKGEHDIARIIANKSATNAKPIVKPLRQRASDAYSEEALF